MKIYDVIVLGAGPAGITASIYLARKKVEFLVVTKDIGGQTIYSSEVENYTGYQFITGAELTFKFKEHLDMFDIQVNMPEEIQTVQKRDDGLIYVKTNVSEYSSKTLIIATGRTPRSLGVENEAKLKGRGVTYCATCDAPLFKDKDVVVVGGGNSALDAVLQLTKYAKKIYLVDIADNLKADKIMIDKAFSSGIVEYFNNSKITKILGENFVEGVVIEKTTNKTTKELQVQGVFVEIGSIPASNFIDGINKNKDGEIIVDCMCRTSIAGIFAAGDVTNVFAKQIIIACGEGAKAALAAYDYLNKNF